MGEWGGEQFTSRSERRHTYFVSSLSRGSNSLHLVVEDSALTTTVADLEGVHGVSVELPFGTKLFHFHEEFLEKVGKMVKCLKSNPALQI